MENQITTIERAKKLTDNINANTHKTIESYINIGRDLKTVRDEKLYEAMGYSGFDEYCDAETDVKQRQAYNCIKAFETYGDRIDAVRSISFTNLIQLTALDEEDRAELIENGDAERLSARELQKKIDEMKRKCEQLTLDLGEKSKVESQLEKVKAEMEKLRIELDAQKDIGVRKDERIKELESKPVDVAVQKPSKDEIAKIEKAAAEKAEKAAQKQHEKELAELKEKDERQRLKAVEAVKSESAAEVERLKAELEKSKSENAVLQANAKKSPPTGEKERIKLCLEEVQRNFNMALETVGKLPENERDKLKGKLKVIVERMGAML